MKKKLIFTIFFMFLLVLVFFLNSTNVYEEVYDVPGDTVTSGEIPILNDNGYDVYVTDSEIRFFDEKGNSIIYVFENDRLANVFNVYNAENEVEARKISAYFTAQIGNGEFLKVNHLDNVVSVQMDMNFFSEYKDYTMKEVEEILLQNANLENREE